MARRRGRGWLAAVVVTEVVVIVLAFRPLSASGDRSTSEPATDVSSSRVDDSVARHPRSTAAPVRAGLAPAPAGTIDAENVEASDRAPSELAPEAPVWLSPVMRCGLHRGRTFCNGPRRVPRPHGAAGALAERLGLGTHEAAAKLLRSYPRREWIEATREHDIEPPRRLLWPVEGANFGRGFGRDERHLHEGVDVGAESGELIRAVAGGLVAYADNSVRGYGNLLIVLHGGTRVGVYAHCREIRVFPGQKVERGQVVAVVGNTGISRGSHLHFEWHARGRAVDPARLFVR